MNIKQRLANLEQAIKPNTDTRKPLLVQWAIPIGETPKPDDDGGILYIYDGVPASTYNLTYKEVTAYEASDLPADEWVKTQPQLKAEV